MTLIPASNANEELMDRLYQSWREQNPETLIDCFTDDCTYTDMAMRVVMRGKKELAGFVNEVYKTMPDFHVEHSVRFASATRGSGYWTISATWNGPFEGIDRTGTKVRFEGISLYEFRDGKISRNIDCWDPTMLYEQFGILPAALRSLSTA